MNEFPEPDKIIEIDLPKVAKNSLTLTASAFLLLWILKIVIERDFSFSINRMDSCIFHCRLYSSDYSCMNFFIYLVSVYLEMFRGKG